MAAVFVQLVKRKEMSSIISQSKVKSSLVCNIKSLGLVYLVVANKIKKLLIIQILQFVYVQLAPEMGQDGSCQFI